MAQKLYLADGEKAVNLLDSEDPSIWNYYGGKTDAGQNELYARVAAAFTAVNKVSRAVANTPFAIMRGKVEYDTSAKWENKIGIMPNPRDLLRRVRQSLVMSNKAYLIMGRNKLGIPKQLHFAVQTSIDIITDPTTGQLVALNRLINGRIEKSYKPDDNELIRLWWLDDKTELLPSPDTEFKAIMNSAGVLYWADSFTKIFFQRGGVKPTLIAMKGMVAREDQKDMVNDWTKFLRGIGQAYRNVSAKIFNAETMDIKPFGDGLGDLKETPVFKQALENIAIGLNMPLSMLLSNSNNYATAQVEQRSFYHDNVVPWFDFIADGLNEQVLIPMGLRMENRAEADDAMQEEEVLRQSAATGFGDVFTKYPSFDLLVASLSGIFGYELTDQWLAAAEKYYAEKEIKAKELQAQMQQAQEIQPANENPNAQPNKQPVETEEEQEEKPKKKPFVKFIPTLDHMDEMRTWREVALRYFKRAEPIPEYIPHHGGLPDDINDAIKAALSKADSVESIKASFDIATPVVVPEEVRPDDDIRLLAASFNRLADAMGNEKSAQPMTLTIHNHPSDPTPITVEAAKAADAPIVNIVVDPTPVTVQNTVNVPEAQVTVNNDIRPSQVVIAPPRNARVVRNRDGKIEGLEAG